MTRSIVGILAILCAALPLSAQSPVEPPVDSVANPVTISASPMSGVGTSVLAGGTSGPSLLSVTTAVPYTAPETSASSASAKPLVIRAAMARPVERPKLRTRQWYGLMVAQHSAAMFDAWSTRRSVNAGARELNPLMKPFAGSNAIYPALQILPTAMDYVGLKFRSSRRPWMRRLWWMPQGTSTFVSLVCGVKNLQVAGQLR